MRTALKILVEEGKVAERRGKRSFAASRYAHAAIRLRRSGRLAPARSLLERAIRLSPASPKLYVQLVLLCADERRMDAAGEALELCADRVRARPDRREEYDTYVERELSTLPSLLAAYQASVRASDRNDSHGSSPVEPHEATDPGRQEPVVIAAPVVEDPDEFTLSSLIRKLELELDLEPIAFAKVTLPEGFVERLQDALRDARDAVDLGIAFIVMEQPEVAASFFDRVAEDDVRYGEAQCLAAGAFAAASDWLQALDRALRAVRVPPRTVDVLAEGTYQLAWAYARLGDFAQARVRLALLEKTFPHYRDVVGLRAFVGTDTAEEAAPTGMPPADKGAN